MNIPAPCDFLLDETTVDKEVQQYRKNVGLSLESQTRSHTRVCQIAEYLMEHNIKSVVLGVSGGVDSALALALLNKVSLNYINDLQIKAVFFKQNVHNKEADEEKISLLKEAFSDRVCFERVVLKDSIKELAKSINCEGDVELIAQIGYAMMYTTLFGIAQRDGAITVGTANRDELGFIGWFGKNSDMMTDIQIIHDYHKFEVQRDSRILGVPESICSRTPTGDLLSGLTDEEVFGCSYDEVSFMTWLYQEHPERINAFLRNRYKKLFELHEKNKHKYQGQTFNPVFIGKGKVTTSS